MSAPHEIPILNLFQNSIIQCLISKQVQCCTCPSPWIGHLASLLLMKKGRTAHHCDTDCRCSHHCQYHLIQLEADLKTSFQKDGWFQKNFWISKFKSNFWIPKELPKVPKELLKKLLEVIITTVCAMVR